ncbi:MAG: serine/threonine protein kinase [Deltaproteobacteria bacterium]|nr:serine/threonine protein kinase [Deltaproteobacteria bacterium]
MPNLDLSALDGYKYTGHSGNAWEDISDGKLGQGGQGSVNRVWCDRLKMIGAMKKIATKRDPEQARARFDQELNALSEIQHPCVVKLLDYGHDPIPFIVTQVAEYGSLRRHVALLKNDTWRTLRIARDAALGLACLHENQFVHRDVKPDNILLLSLSHAAIGDLGVVRYVNDAVALPKSPSLTKTDESVGNTRFAPPEFFSDDDRPKATFAFDVFGLGAVVHAVLSGKTDTRRAYGMRESYISLCDTLKDSNFSGIDRLLEKMMSHNPSKRPTMREVIDSLDELLNQRYSGGCPSCGRLDSERIGSYRQVYSESPNQSPNKNVTITMYRCRCGRFDFR